MSLHDAGHLQEKCRSSHPEVCIKIGALKYLENFTGKDLHWSFVFNNLQAKTLLKKDSGTRVSCEFYQFLRIPILKNEPPVTASEYA